MFKISLRLNTFTCHKNAFYQCKETKEQKIVLKQHLSNNKLGKIETGIF